MKFIKDLCAGDRINEVYFCKQKTSAVTRNGKNYENCLLQDKTGVLDAKIWDPDSQGIGDFSAMDFVEVNGEVSLFNGSLQLSIKRARFVRADAVDKNLYFPMTEKDQGEMLREILSLVDGVGNPHLKALLDHFFREDADFIDKFIRSSAAKTIHHGFIGGLLEHTLGVAKLCQFYADQYPTLDRDLLMTAAICHDMGKVRELSPFPANDYTDEGQFVGHIVIGAQMLSDYIEGVPDFPRMLGMKLIHCILSHHGEYEFGSPKKPAIPEALALNLADNTDAKLEAFKEALAQAPGDAKGWLGFNKLFETNLYKD